VPEPDSAFADLESIGHALRHDVMDPDAVRADAEAAADMLRQVPPLRVVVCGEYGRGKSTLLSALARRRLFPHMPDDTTSVATTLAWGTTDTAVVSHATADGLVAERTIDIRDVQRFVTEVGTRSMTETVIGVQLQAPLEALARGLEMTDTPGVHSRNPMHNLITQQWLERAGAIVFVTSTDGPLSDLEVEAFHSAAATGAPVIAVLAKTDARDPQVQLASAQKRLSDRLGRPVEVLPVSAVMALDGQEDRDVVLEDESGVPELYRRLAALAAAHRAQWALPDAAGEPGELSSPVGLLASALTALRASAASELATIRRAEDEDRAFLNAIEDAQRKLASLTEAAEYFHREIRGQVTRKVGEIQRKVTDACEKLILQTSLDLTMVRSAVTPAAYQSGLVQRLGVIANWADFALDGFLRGVIDDARRLTESELGYLPALPSGPVLSADGVATPGRRTRISFDAVRKGIRGSGMVATYGGSVGGIVGSLVGLAPGAVVGAALGALIGHIAGTVAGTLAAARNDEQAQDATDLHHIALTAQSLIEGVQKQINARLAENAPAEIDRLSRAVDALIAQRRTQLQIQQAQAESNSAADRAERTARSAALAGQLATLDRLDGTLARACERLQILVED
jgi:signal recognition particle receptor subunit beta